MPARILSGMYLSARHFDRWLGSRRDMEGWEPELVLLAILVEPIKVIYRETNQLELGSVRVEWVSIVGGGGLKTCRTQ